MSCPICSKKTEAAWRTFCSKRCADVDLARWLGEGYRIGGDADTEDGAPPAPNTDNRSAKGH